MNNKFFAALFFTAASFLLKECENNPDLDEKEIKQKRHTAFVFISAAMSVAPPDSEPDPSYQNSESM